MAPSSNCSRNTGIAQALPLLTFACVAATHDEDEEKNISSGSSCRDDASDKPEHPCNATCSTASASDRCDGSDASDVSDTDGTPRNVDVRGTTGKPLRLESQATVSRWADCETDDEDILWASAPCIEIKPPKSRAPEATPLSLGAKGFVPKSVANATRLDFGKIVAAGLVAMRSCPLVASSEVQESTSGGGWALSCCLRSDQGGTEQFAALQIITQHVQVALLQAAEVSQQSYVVGYAAEPFAPLGLGFLLQLAAVDDDTQACWDFISTGYCSRGCRCRWRHPAESVCVEVHIKLSAGASG